MDLNLNIQGDIQELDSGLEELRKAYNFSLSDYGIFVTVCQRNMNMISITLSEGRGKIQYNEKIHFYRALSLFLEHAQKSDSFHIEEEPQFNMSGIMLDCSRNAVMKPEQVKKLIRVMSMMGLNMLMLYMEDTYEIKNQPYFGYMRGRYSKEELKQLDEYAYLFGIELIPGIQTLAHLSTFLRWDVTEAIRDTSDILLAGSEDTYQIIEQMITAASEPFRTSRIHIGMDEAHMLGRGQYLKKNGYKPSFQIINEHLKEVLKITKEKDLFPMIWSDMYFRMASEKGHYYDTEAIIPDEVIQNIPGDVQFVYWDYYHEDEEVYRNFLQKHKAFGSTPLFAGGLWTWNGITVNYNKAFNTTNAAMPACKKEGIKEVFATLWGDDGQETDLLTSLLGLQLLAEHSYANEMDREKLSNRFKFCTGAEMDAFLLLGEPDQLPGEEEGIQLEPDNPSKFLLWQDPLTGLFDSQIRGPGLNRYFAILADRLQEAKKHAGEWEFLFEVPSQICSVLSLKAELGSELKKHYATGAHEQLKHMVNLTLPKLIQKVERLKDLHYAQWMKSYKPFGWEVMDIRYGGLLARLRTTQHRLIEYLEGRQTSIPELEEERLPYTTKARGGYVRSNVYKKIVTPNVF